MSERVVSTIVAIFVLGALAVGWQRRTRLGITPEHGLGYWLGIVGVAMMLLLLTYPLRKRVAGALPGSVGLWFRIHMLLGLLGPIAILYHARFTFDAINSGVALTAMLVVAGSGVVGRYIHAHVYRGFSLHHVEAAELVEEIAAARALLDADGDPGDEIRTELGDYATRAMAARRSLPHAIAQGLRLGVEVRLRRRAIRAGIAQHFADAATQMGWSADELAQHQRDAAVHLDLFLERVRAIAAFAAFDRLFALWHHLHLPLFGFLVLAATTHIVAVHLY